ncbi:MAG: hypothetical protein LUG55_04365 [Clostridiales bacterium]|nr:hypothetical protein [Clostridiales bacterium]
MSYTISIDPGILDARLPKLTLQPLVENALYHGVKLKRGQGHIAVKGWAEDGCVLLTVTDDGVGMPPPSGWRSCGRAWRPADGWASASPPSTSGCGCCSAHRRG